MLEIIILHTNEEIDRKYCVEPRASYQTHVNLDELKAFIGLLYFSGIQKWNHTALDEIWSERFGH